MRIVLFYHSLISDWNHGNAHFLRGIVTELMRRGHHVAVYEPHNAWSVENLIRCEGKGAIRQFRRAFPTLHSIRYTMAALNLDEVLADADLVIVHEWNEKELIRKLGAHRRRNGHYRLLFHDTHHRSISDSATIAGYSLGDYDGVLAFGEVVRARYLDQGWAPRAWTWHEAADTARFYPRPSKRNAGDLVWIGNWGDDERTERLREFLFTPVGTLNLSAAIYGVRYPEAALRMLAKQGIEYRGWLPNVRVPEVFAGFRATVHIPRAPYVAMLPGIPTIRVFEALACGIPLVCSPWDDAEHLFTPGRDYLTARSGAEMGTLLRMLLREPDVAQSFAQNGLRTIQARHTCGHRVDELLAICHAEFGLPVGASPPSESANAPGMRQARARTVPDPATQPALQPMEMATPSAAKDAKERKSIR